MGSSNTQQSSGATDQAVSVSGSGGTTLAQGLGIAVGQGATLTTGTRVASSTLNNSTVTFGETGLGQTFADTIKALNEENTKALTDALSNRDSSANLPSANKDIPDPADTNAGADTSAGPGVNWALWGGIAAGLAAVWFFFFRRK